MGGNIGSSDPINPEGIVGQVYLAVDARARARTIMSICSPARNPPVYGRDRRDVGRARIRRDIQRAAPRE